MRSPIIALDPNTRSTGYAIIEGGQLTEHGYFESTGELVFERAASMARQVAQLIHPIVTREGYREDAVALIEWPAALGQKAHPNLLTAACIVAAYPLIKCVGILVAPGQWKRRGGKQPTMLEAKLAWGITAPKGASTARLRLHSDECDAVIMATRFEAFANQCEAGNLNAIDLARDGQRFN